MFFPEQLYLLSQKDQQVSWLEPLVLRDSFTDVGDPITRLLYRVPQGRVLLLQNLAARADAGAAQNILNLTFDAVPLWSANPIIIKSGDARQSALGTPNAAIDWSGSILIPAQYTLRLTADWSAAAVANSLDIGVMGLLIPQGNLQTI